MLSQTNQLPRGRHHMVSLQAMVYTLSLHGPLQEGPDRGLPLTETKKRSEVAQGCRDEDLGNVQWYTISVMPAEKVLGICCTRCL